MERISLEEARARLLAKLVAVGDVERVSPVKAPGRVLAADLTAQINVPPFDKSPLDGYALRSADLAGAGAETPAVLTVIDRVFAGGWCHKTVAPGQAVRIMTGAPIPAGADCVVQQEDTNSGEEKVAVYVRVSAHQNFCFRGEDISAGMPMFPVGTRLDWTHVAALAGQGFTGVEVLRRPRVAVLMTGDELCAAGTPLPEGKIYDSNGPMLCARLEALHMESMLCPLGADDPASLAALIEDSLARCDMVVTSGGVSVGQKDCMPRVAALLGAEVLFHGVAVRPGSPAMGLMVKGKPVVALSGNPFAAAAVFETLVRPALERLSGCSGDFLRQRSAILRGSSSKPSGVRRLVRARLDGEEVFLAKGGHASGMALGMAGCNCLVDIPADACPTEGARVTVFCL